MVRVTANVQELSVDMLVACTHALTARQKLLFDLTFKFQTFQEAKYADFQKKESWRAVRA